MLYVKLKSCLLYHEFWFSSWCCCRHLFLLKYDVDCCCYGCFSWRGAATVMFSFRLFTVVICQLLLLFVVWFGLLLLTFTCCLPRPTAIDGPSGRRDVCNESFREQLIDWLIDWTKACRIKSLVTIGWKRDEPRFLECP